MVSRVKLALAALVVLIASGCGSTLNLVYGPKPYGGVLVDGAMAHESVAEPLRFPLALLWLSDLPLSLAFDTLTLPLTLGDRGGHPLGAL